MTQQSAGRDQRNFKGIPAPNFANNQTVEQVAVPPSETPKTQSPQLLSSSEKQTDLIDSPTFSEQKSNRWWGERKLRFKVMTLAVALATLPVIGIGAAAYYFTNQTFTQQVIAERKGYSLSVQSKISFFLRRRVGDIRVMSQLSIFTSSRQRADLDAQQKQEVLDRFVEAYEVYDNIAVLDLKGDVIAQSIGERLPNLSDRKYFQQALKADKPIISQPEAGTLTKVLSIYVVAPIKDSVTNKTVALIQARIPGDYFRTDVFSEEAQRKSSKVYLVDSSGKLFVTPQGIGASSVDDQGRPTVNAEGKIQAIDAQSILPAYSQMRDDDKPRVELSSDKLFTLTPIDNVRDLPPLNWKLLIAEDKAAVFAAQDQLILALEVGVAIATLLAGAIAALVANRAVIPILTATSAVTKIGQGDFDTRVDIQGKDEIALLGANINQMATQLQRSSEARALESKQERVLTDAKGSGALRALDLQMVFDQAVESVLDLMKLDRVVIFRFDSDQGIISESVSTGWSSAIEQQISDSCIPEDIREAYRKGRVVAAPDVAQVRSFSSEHFKLLENLEVKALLSVPIVFGDQLFGLLIAHCCSSTYDWQEFEINFLKRLASEIGQTIYRVELLEQTTKLAAEQRQLKEGLQKRALELLQEVDPISKGDLMIRAKVTADEIGTIADSYNVTVDSLREIVLQVQKSTDQVVETTSMSETSVQLLSTEALRQAEEIAAALELVKEMAAAVREVAINAEQAEVAVQLSAETVREGDEAMNRTVDGIQAIRRTVAETAKKVKYLGESSQKISTVVDLISAFAAQTNMLALNASIAAARAGEEGKGFAVVAEEVRALARQSAEATEEIKKLIVNIQTETREVVTAMESGTEQVVAGTKLVDETRQSLNKISTVSSQIGHLVEAIAQATVVQSKASKTVTETIQDVATIANKTSNEADQVSSSFVQLRRVAQALQESVDKFKVS